MADYIGRLVYEITGDTSGVEKSFNDTKSSASVFSTFMGGWAVKLAGIIGSAFAINKLVDWNKKMLEAASAANETASRFGGTFATAIKKANAAVSDLTSQYGFSTQAAQDAMSATGGLVKTLGATDDQAAEMAETVAKLGADMASYVNYAGGAKGAADALTRAMLGETDAAKGLSLSLGDESLAAYARSMGKTVDSLNSVEKAQLRLNLAMSQASAMGAVGDMIKTAAGYANTLRAVESKIEDAEAKAGQKLIPAVTELTREFGNAVAPGGVFSGVLDEIAAAGATAASALASLLKKLNNISAASTLSGLQQSLTNIQRSFDITNERIDRSYGGLEKLKAAAAGGNSEAKVLLGTYNRQSKTIEDMTAQMKKLRETEKSDKAAEAQKKINKLYEDAESIYANATRTLRMYSGVSKDATVEQIAADKNNITAQESAIRTMKTVNAMREEAYKLEQKYNTSYTPIDDTPPAPTKTAPRMGPTQGKTDLKGTIKSAQEAIEAITKLDGETIALANELNSLDAGQIKNVKESLEKASPAAQSFSETFENVDISHMLSDIVDVGRHTMSIEQLTDKWGDKLKKAGDAAAAIRVDKSAGPQIKSAIDQAGEAFEELKKKINRVNDAMQTWGDAGLNVLNGMAAATSAYYDGKLAGLDAQMEAELKAAGVAEETAVEKAQREYDAAVKSGDQTAINEKKKALTKAKIEEEYAKKKSDLEYKAAMRAWQYQEAAAVAEVPLAIGRAVASASAAPWPTTPAFIAAYAAIAGTAAGLQLAAVTQAKPQRSNYARGGIVPGSMYTGDKVQANVNSGEMILNSEQQMQLWKAANGSSAAVSGQPTVINVYLPSNELWFSGLYDATANGQAMVHPNGIAAR